MMELDTALNAVAFLSALGAGLVAGIFFAFSTFVMKALRNLPREQGIAAMQQINVTVLNGRFFSAFFGTALGALVVLVAGIANFGEAGTGALVLGAFLYLVGCILVTVVFNVPLNEALARVDPESREGGKLWSVYLPSWTAWNHVRTITSLGSAASLMVALL